MSERLTTREKQAVALVGETNAVDAPDSLRMEVEAMVAERSPRRKRMAIGSALVAGAVIVAMLVVFDASGSSDPTVGEVVAASSRGALMAAPGEDPSEPGHLALGVQGVQFPYWQEEHGLKAVGARSETVGGRPVNTVFYESDEGASLAYSIVSGPPIDALEKDDGDRDGDDYVITGKAGTKRIVWRNAGHTCIIEARGVTADQLEALVA